MTNNVLTFIAEVAEQVWEDPPPVLEESTVSASQLLADLEWLEWIMLGHPGHGAKLLEEMYLRYAHAPAPKKGERATVWYRMRNHILHLWNNWDRLTCYLTMRHSEGLEINATNNGSERAIGWSVKDRYRATRPTTTPTVWIPVTRRPYNYHLEDGGSVYSHNLKCALGRL